MSLSRLTVTSFATAVALYGTAPEAAQSFSDESPVLVGDHGDSLSIAKISGALYSSDTPATQSRATQLAFGPGPDPARVYLYVSSHIHGIRRFDYDPGTGALSNRVDVFPSVQGNGIALRTNALGHTEMYTSGSYTSANAPSRTLSRLRRFVDRDGDGVFGSVGDADAVIAQGIPRGHSMNQIQILDDTLYVGNGTRTENGALQTPAGDVFGESAFGGTILMIEDLDAVPTVDNAAGFPAYLPDPTEAQYEAIIDGAAPGTDAPYTSTASNKLRVHSAGTRNPFGVAIDRHGALWFTGNFHRVNNSAFDRSVIDDSADLDGFVGSSNDDIHDQMFRASTRADYGYRNGNWQGNPTVQAAGFFAGVGDPAQITPSHTFDNYDPDGAGGPDPDSTNPAFDQLHHPANPQGLGPHAAVTGLAFSPVSFPARYYDHALVARWNGQFGIIDGLDYRDIVLVNAAIGDVETVVSGLNAPIDVVDDGYGHLLIASYYGSIWRLTSTARGCQLCSKWGGREKSGRIRPILPPPW